MKLQIYPFAELPLIALSEQGAALVLYPKKTMQIYQIEEAKINNKLVAQHRAWGIQLVYQASFWIFAELLGLPFAKAVAMSNLVLASLISGYVVTAASLINQPTTILWGCVAVITLVAAVLHSGGCCGVAAGTIVQCWACFLAIEGASVVLFPGTTLKVYGARP